MVPLICNGNWHFHNGPERKIDEVLLEHVELLHVLPLTIQLFFLDGKVGVTIMALSYSLSFVVPQLVAPLLHA